MPKPNSSSSVSDIKAYIRMKKLNQPELKLSLGKADLVAGLKKHGHWSESGTASTTTKGNARKGKPVGSRLAFDATKQEANKKKKFVYPANGNKPKGMTMTEWRTDPKNKSRSRELYSKR